MKIISGKFKGRNVYLNEGIKSRPITSKILKAIFDILKGRISDSYFLDLFSGSGIVGIEAISRGAKFVTFVEIERKTVKNILENLKRVGVNFDKGKFLGVEILNRDVFRFINKSGKYGQIFDVVFLDPPFNMGYGDKCLEYIDNNSKYFLHNESCIVIRISRDEKVNYTPKNIVLNRKSVYGSSVVLFYKLNQEIDNN